MSQNDLTIANQTASSFRSDLNSALQALVTLSSGSSAPSNTFPNMLWYDTTNNILRMRTNSDDAWINLFYVNEATDELEIYENTQIRNVDGGLEVNMYIGGKTEALWRNGVSAEECLISPAKLKSVISANILGAEQEWVDVTSSRSTNTSYRNTTGSPIQVNIHARQGGGITGNLQVSTDNSTWVNVARVIDSTNDYTTISAIVPDNHYYRLQTADVELWSELR